MTITTEKKDLFTIPQGYYLAHCISADFTLGAGIAKVFDKTYNMRFKLFRNFDDYEYDGGDALLIDNVFNLVTKKKYWHKPTYATLKGALEDMKIQILQNDIHYLAMPLIGSGLDRLDWTLVRKSIQEIFSDVDINIIVVKKG